MYADLPSLTLSSAITETGSLFTQTIDSSPRTDSGNEWQKVSSAWVCVEEERTSREARVSRI